MFLSFLVRNLSFILLFIGLIAIDQLTKYLIRFFGGFYLCNQGIAWGINLSPAIFWLIWAVIVFLIVWFFLYGNGSKISNLSLLVILAGASGNIIDRITAGCVIDFIDFGFWPIFNLADSFIVLGALTLMAKNFKLWYNSNRLFSDNYE